MLLSLCTLPHRRPTSPGNPSNFRCSAKTRAKAGPDRRGRRGLTIPAGAALLAAFFVGAAGMTTLHLGTPGVAPAPALAQQSDAGAVVPLSRLGDGVLLIRTNEQGRRELRTISSISSPLMKDLSASEIALVETAFAALLAGPKCLTETGPGGITCENVACLGECFVDGYSIDPDSGAITHYQIVGETIDTHTVTTPTVALCGCL